MNQMKLLFAYGSLKKGFGNHPLLSDSKLLGEDVLDLGYSMISFGPYPGLVSGGGYPIHGEIYEVSDDTFNRVEMLEGSPTFYRPVEVETKFGTATIYVLNEETRSYRVSEETLVRSGNWGN
jgi:gamma-glutamylcyclotransferase (GGCT)/AIG2-like uncharacterized protein YtfP